MEKNIGNLDATLRSLLGIFLIWLGLFSMKGINGNLWGIVVALVSLAPFTFSLTRKCPIFHFFNISSIPKKKS
jgi:hypothetical protein